MKKMQKCFDEKECVILVYVMMNPNSTYQELNIPNMNRMQFQRVTKSLEEKWCISINRIGKEEWWWTNRYNLRHIFTKSVISKLWEDKNMLDIILQVGTDMRVQTVTGREYKFNSTVEHWSERWEVMYRNRDRIKRKKNNAILNVWWLKPQAIEALREVINIYKYNPNIDYNIFNEQN